MAELAEKKTARGKQKTKVTKGINKLKSSLVYCSDFGKLKERADSLESEFYNLSDIHEECIEMGAEVDDYMVEITRSFEECMKSFFAMTKEEKEKTLMQKASPLKTDIDRDLTRIETVIERIHVTLVRNLVM